MLGVGLILQGPAVRALQIVGILDRCLQEGFGTNELLIGDASGRVFARFPQPQLAGPEYPAIIGILRPTFHTILADTSREAGIRIRLGLSIAALSQDANAVEVEFTDETRGDHDLGAAFGRLVHRNENRKSWKTSRLVHRNENGK